MEKKRTMKKTVIVTLSVLLLLMLSLVGIATAYNDTYTHYLYQQEGDPPTIDGTYIVDAEWLPSGPAYFDGSNTTGFHDYWVMTPNLYCCLIDVADNTTDAADKLIICFDGTAEGGDTQPDGGANPTEYDKKLEITGHGVSATVEWFKGDGSGWVTATASAELLEYAQSLTSTPKVEADHYVYELQFLKNDDTSLGSPLVPYQWAQFVSYYDDDTGETQQWPPADATPAGDPDNPDSWGYIPYAMGANPTPDIPEGISIIAILALSSAAAAGTILIRKRTKLVVRPV